MLMLIEYRLHSLFDAGCRYETMCKKKLADVSLVVFLRQFLEGPIE